VITSDSPAGGPRPYSTRLRTAIVLTGTGTAGAYHAGVLRALHEAGVRIDLAAGRGIGALGAMFAAVDGGQRLWDREGLWKQPGIGRAYRWRLPLRVAGWALAAAIGLLAIPLALSAAGVVAGGIGVLLWLVNLTGASAAVTSAYGRALDALFAPAALPTIIPRFVVFCLVVGVAALAAGLGVSTWRAAARRRSARGALWRLFGSPVSAGYLLDCAVAELWNLIRGAAAIAPPARQDLGRRYIELLGENLGQPGFRELLLVAHDMDARQDVLFALLADGHRQRFFGRAADGSRQTEAFDLSGIGREHVIDALAANLATPVAADPHLVRFPPEGPWRGETHRLCDRPGALERLLEEVAVAGAEQVLVLSAAPPPGRPHELSSARADLRGRAAEQLGAFEAADLRDALQRSAQRFAGLYVIRPAHNPVGPLDFRGVYDERSDRHYSLGELVDRGYEDAYHQFIEPVVAASGERIVTVQS
jgi:patatin-like phospholipase